MKNTITVYTCDRCGKQFDDNPSIKNICFTTSNGMKDGKYIQYGGLTKDLCQVCADDFIEWWDRGDGDCKFAD